MKMPNMLGNMNSGLQHYSDDELLRSLGRQIQQARTAKGLSRQELARRSVVNRNTVENAERGKDITLGTALRLWRALDLIDSVPLPSGIARPRRLQAAGQPSPVSPMDLLAERRRSAP